MSKFWCKNDIEKILLQLEERRLLFKGYRFSKTESGLKCIGTGSTAYVFEVASKSLFVRSAAIKVIGFRRPPEDYKKYIQLYNEQKDLRLKNHNVIKTYDSVDLFVYINEDNDVLSAQKITAYYEDENRDESDNLLHLRFILTEMAEPVVSIGSDYGKSICKNKFRNLINYSEKEVLKCALDIGEVLLALHRSRIIHKDVKLDNVFYRRSTRKYVLGDFGAADLTDDGFTQQHAYSRGYGAPEVVMGGKAQFDHTADIYSLGMLLYVLMNNFNFPDSTNFPYPNLEMQYSEDYIMPKPVNGSEKLQKIVLKMTRFNPDERYQSMEEVMAELDGISYGDHILYQKNHSLSYLAVSSIIAMIAVFSWRLFFGQDTTSDYSVGLVVTFSFIVIKGIMELEGGQIGFLRGIIAILGVVMLFTDFEWYGLALVVAAVLFSGNIINFITSIFAAGRLFWIFAGIYHQYITTTQKQVYDGQWIVVMTVLLAVLFGAYYFMLKFRYEASVKMYYKNNKVLLIMLVMFVGMYFTASKLINPESFSYRIWSKFIGEQSIENINSWNLKKASIFGSMFMLFFITREGVMRMIYSRKHHY